MTRTYSLSEVAEMVLPPEWKQPELWLMRRLRRGEICGYKVGHSWRMRQSDVDALIETYPNTHVADVVEPVSVLEGLSARARRKIGVLMSYLLPVFVSWLFWCSLLVGGWMLGGCGG